MGGFAQNFAGRRIPFENAAYPLIGIAPWARACTFPPSPRARPAILAGHGDQGRVAHRHGVRELARRHAAERGRARKRGPSAAAAGADGRRAGAGPAGTNRMKFVGAGDSGTVGVAQFKVFLLRTSTLQPRGANYALGWKRSPSGAVDGARPTTARRHSLRWPRRARRLKASGTRRTSFCSRSAALHPLARKLQPSENLRGRQHLCGGIVDAAAALRLVGRHGSARSEPHRTRATRGASPGESACVLSIGWAAACRRRARGSIRRTPITVRSCSSSASTTRRWRRTCRSPRRGALCS